MLCALENPVVVDEYDGKHMMVRMVLDWVF